MMNKQNYLVNLTNFKNLDATEKYLTIAITLSLLMIVGMIFVIITGRSYLVDGRVLTSSIEYGILFSWDNSKSTDHAQHVWFLRAAIFMICHGLFALRGQLKQCHVMFSIGIICLIAMFIQPGLEEIFEGQDLAIFLLLMAIIPIGLFFWMHRLYKRTTATSS
jgi:hypothetical protein